MHKMRLVPCVSMQMCLEKQPGCPACESRETSNVLSRKLMGVVAVDLDRGADTQHHFFLHLQIRVYGFNLQCADDLFK